MIAPSLGLAVLLLLSVPDVSVSRTGVLNLVQVADAIQGWFDEVSAVSYTLTVKSSTGVKSTEVDRRVRCWQQRPGKSRTELPDGSIEIVNGREHWWIPAGGKAERMPDRALADGERLAHPGFLWRFARLGCELEVAEGIDGEGMLVARHCPNGGLAAKEFVIDTVRQCIVRVALYDGSGALYEEAVFEYDLSSGLPFPVRIEERYWTARNSLHRVYEYDEVRINERIPSKLFRP